MSLNTIITLNNEDTEKCIDFYYTRNKDFETINVKGFFNDTELNIGLRITKETNEKLYMIFDIFDKKVVIQMFYVLYFQNYVLEYLDYILLLKTMIHVI